MPIHVEIGINFSPPLTTIKIGRAQGGVSSEDINRYVVTRGAWDADDAVQFDHRYGDGLEVCVAKGMQALVDLGSDAQL